MKRLEYLKLSIQWKCYRRVDWFITAFAVFREEQEAWKKDSYPGRVVSSPWGYSFVNQQLELEKIEDAKPNEPLFNMLEELTVDPTWLPNIKEPTVTLIGALMTNAILLVESFGNKIPYMAEDISISAIENFIIQNRGTEKEPEKIQIHEYQKMGQGVELMKMLHSFSVYSLTKKNTTPPTGLKEFKAKLIAEYGDKLKDPVYLAEFEDRLKAFDTEYLKGDPTLGKLVSGKIKNNGRRKLFLSSGAEGGNSSAVSGPVSGGEDQFRNIQIESTPSEPQKASNYRRLEWKKLQKMQAHNLWFLWADNYKFPNKLFYLIF